ncbi:MAG: hypothetical protein PHI12_07620 [Dehalococcoidales bacterium]|nr:hypothetical protein [Dehalococcoidales bacterium]
MKRETVLKTIEPLVEGKIRDVKDSSGTRILVTPDMVQLRPGRGSPAIDVADKRSLMEFAGLPLGLAGKLSPETFSKALSELLQGHGSYSMVVKDDKITSLVPFGTRRTVEPDHLLDLLEKTIPVEEYMRVMIDKQTVSLEVAGTETAPVIAPDGTHIPRGDLVKAGVLLRFSPMGITRPFVQSYAVRLVCTNGLTSNTVLSEFTGGGGEGDSVWQFFRQSIRRAYNSFDKVVSGWKKLVDEKVPPEERARMLEALIKDSGITGSVAEAIRARAIEQPPENAWDMQNLITYATSHLIERGNTRQIMKALKVVADFGDEATHRLTCPLCHRQN